MLLLKIAVEYVITTLILSLNYIIYDKHSDEDSEVLR
jgi:hypothetical protein